MANDDGRKPVGGAAFFATRPGTKTVGASPQNQTPKEPPGLPRPPQKLPVPLRMPLPPRSPPVAFQAPPEQPSGPLRAGQVQSTQTLSDELRACYPATGPIAAYMDWAHRLTHAPPQFHLASILPVIAYEANRRKYTLAQSGEALHVWTLVVAQAGLGKTTSQKYASSMHEAWGLRTHGPTWRNPWESTEGSISGVMEALLKHYDESTQTTNAILQHSELSKILRDDSLEGLCMLFDQGSIKRNLRYKQKREDDGEQASDTLKNIRISATFTTTASSLREVFRETMLQGGFASRLLWFSGMVEKHQIMPMQLSDDAGKHRVVEAFHDWSGVLDGMALLGANQSMELAPEANAAYLKYFYSDLCDLIDAGEQDDGWGSLATRYAVYSLRVAALYALVCGRTTIMPEDMQPAINLTRMLLKGLQQLLPRVSPESFFQKSCRRVQEAVHLYSLSQKGDADTKLISRGWLFKALRLRMKIAEFEEILQALVESGILAEVPTPVKVVGRPTKWYRIMPKE